MAPDETIARTPDTRLLERIGGYIRPYPWLIVGSLVLLPVVMVFDLVQPKILQVAIDRVIAQRRASDLPLLAAAYLGALIGQYVASYFQVYFLQLLGERATIDLRVAVYRHVLRLRLAFFDRTPVGKLMTRVSSDVEAINEAFSAGLVTLFADIVRIIAVVAILAQMDVGLTVVTLGSLPVLFLIGALARKVVRHAFRELRTRLGELNGFMQEQLQGMKIVQLFAGERRSEADLRRRNEAYRNANHRAIRADATIYALVEMVGSLAIASLLLAGGSRIAAGTLTIGVLVAFIQYLDRLFAPIRDLSSKYTILQSAMAAAERIFALLDLDEPDSPRRQMEPTSAGRAAHLELDRIGFAYKPDEPVLRDLSLRIEPGETVALVGVSGGGKSTLVKLLLRLYEADTGRILLGGADTRGFAGPELRRRIVMVPQDAFLFSGTIEQNVTMGLDRDKIDLEAIFTQVGADRLLASRAQGLASPVAERGANLSAGERQLLAFARAMARDPEILILDEATANVDPEIEARIERGIGALLGGRTSLVIAHRLSTLSRADRIVVLHQGTIAEQGSHTELLGLGGLYAKLYRLQMEGNPG